VTAGVSFGAWTWILGIVVALYLAHRLAVFAEDRGWIYYRRRGSASSMGNAMLEVQSMFEPGQRAVLEERLRDGAEAEESGDPPEAGAIPGAAAPGDPTGHQRVSKR